MMAAVPLLAFPIHLNDPEAPPAALDAVRKTASNGDGNDGDSPVDGEVVQPLQRLADLSASVKELVSNGTFAALCLEMASEAAILSGMGAFLAKIIESQFSLSSATSAAILGAIIVPCGCGGSFLSGFFIKRYKLGLSRILTLNNIISAVALISSLSFLIGCPTTPVAGVTVPYGPNR